MQEFASKPPGVNVNYVAHWNDALIDRCRSLAATRFLEYTNDDVMVMIDHDITFQAGSVVRLAKKALETNAIVAAMISKKSRGQGIASRLKVKPELVKMPPADFLYESSYPGSGFCAYPRDLVLAVAKSVPRVYQGFIPMFIPTLAKHTNEQLETEEWEYLSEDWAFVKRASELGYKSYIDCWPKCGHVGPYEYKIEDAFCNAKIVKEGEK
jgi:hypothetical protein